MSKKMMEFFHLKKRFEDAGYYESEHHQLIFHEISDAVKLGRLIVLSGIIGSGKTTLLKNIQKRMKHEKDVLIAKSLSLEKDKITLTVLITALFYDLWTDTDKEIKIPSQPEKRVRSLRDIVARAKRPVALFIDDAHDLHSKTLVGLKRLMETVSDGGGILSIVLAGHPKLENDLRRPAFEEIGTRVITLRLDGISASKREYLVWLLEGCINKGVKIDSIMTEEAIDCLSERLATPLQMQYYLRVAFGEAFRIGAKPVTRENIDSVIYKDFDDLEPRLTRQGYNVRALSDILHVRPKIVRLFLKGKLPQGQRKEIQNELLSLGIPL